METYNTFRISWNMFFVLLHLHLCCMTSVLKNEVIDIIDAENTQHDMTKRC